MSNTLTPAFTSTGLGTVQSEESDKTSGLFQQPMPESDSSAQVLIDIFGATRVFNIIGSYAISNGTLATFINAGDDAVNGDQAAQTYHSDTTGRDYTGFITSFKWKKVEGGVNKVEYTIQFTQGTS